MAFTLSGTIVTQTGNDTSWDGLNGIAGVTRISTGDGFFYYAPNLGIEITGTLTIADPSKGFPLAYYLQIKGAGNYTSGSFAADGVTPLKTGVHFISMGISAQMSDTIGNASFGVSGTSRYTLIGGSYQVSGGITYIAGAIVREYGVDVIASRAFGTGSIRVRAFATDVIKRKCRHYDIAYDLFRMPTDFSVQSFGSEYLAQYVGSLAGGVDAKFTAYTPLNTDGTYDFDNWGAGWVELYNSGKGANLNVVTQGARTNHVVPLFQEVNFKVTDLTGVDLQNVRFKAVDAPVSNSPTATITTTGGLKTWDFRTPLSYTGTTDASGVAASVPILQVWWGASSTKNLRFPSSTATYQFRAFASQTQNTTIVLGSDTAIAKGMALVPLATAVTVNEATASALTGITFTASGATGGSVVISANRTLQDLWNYYRWWVSQFANWDSSDTWTCANGQLNMGAWSLTVNSGSALTKTTAIDRLTTTSTITVNGTTDVTYTDSAGTRVSVVEASGRPISTYITVNGTPVGGSTVNSVFVPGWVSLAATRTLIVQPTDNVRIVAGYWGSKPLLVNCLGSAIAKFTLVFETEPGVDTTVSTVARDAVANALLTVTNGGTGNIEMTVNKTLANYTPAEVIAGVGYDIIATSYQVFAACATANTVAIYAISSGKLVLYTPQYKIRMADTDSLGANILPTAAGYSIPIVSYYYDIATSTASPLTILNTHGAKIETAPWTQATASLSDSDKAAIAAASAVNVWAAATRTLTSAAPPTLAQIEASTVLAKEATSAAIKAKTDTLVNGPTLAQIEASTVLAKQSTVAAIKAKTDQIEIGAGGIEADVKYVNGIEVKGSGLEADPWGPV